MREVVEQSEQMGLQGQRGLFDRCKLGAPRRAEPLLEELRGTFRTGLGPELGEGLFVIPGAGSLKVARAQVGETQGAFPVGTRAPQPQIFAAGEALVAALEQATVLLAADLVHRLVEVLGDMKLVVDDHGVPGGLLGGGRELGAHIDGHGLDAVALRGRQAFPQLEGTHRVAILHHVQHSAAAYIGHQRHISPGRGQSFSHPCPRV